MTQEQTDILNKVFEAVFAGRVVAVLRGEPGLGDIITVDGGRQCPLWTITDHAGGFLLEVGMSDCDVAEVSDQRHFPDLVETLVVEMARMKVRNLLDDMATDAMVAEHDAKESPVFLFSRGRFNFNAP